MDDNLLKIKSEFIYESIIYESQNDQFNLFKSTMKFIKKSKNEIFKKMKKYKSEINDSNIIIEYEDFSEFILIFKDLLSRCKKTDDINKVIETWANNKLEPLLDKQRNGRIKKSVKVSIALRTLEKCLNDLDKIFIELNLALTNKKNIKKNNTMEVTSTIRHISDQIVGEILLCINKSSGIKIPKNIKPIDVKLIHNDLNSARERIAYMILEKHKYRIDDIKYIINIAKNKYKNELYQIDKHVKDQDIIYNLKSNSTELDIDTIFKIRSILSNNFSEKKVSYIIEKNFN